MPLKKVYKGRGEGRRTVWNWGESTAPADLKRRGWGRWCILGKRKRGGGTGQVSWVSPQKNLRAPSASHKQKKKRRKDIHDNHYQRSKKRTKGDQEIPRVKGRKRKNKRKRSQHTTRSPFPLGKKRKARPHAQIRLEPTPQERGKGKGRISMTIHKIQKRGGEEPTPHSWAKITGKGGEKVQLYLEITKCQKVRKGPVYSY